MPLISRDGTSLSYINEHHMLRERVALFYHNLKLIKKGLLTKVDNNYDGDLIKRSKFNQILLM